MLKAPIPYGVASKVHNFVNEFDLVPLLANSLVSSGSDADQLMHWFGSEGKVQQVFSEILLYQQLGDLDAAQAVKSENILFLFKNYQITQLLMLKQAQC